MTVEVKAKCVDCGAVRTVKAGGVASDDMPECGEQGCFGVCVAVSAEAS